MPEHRLTLAIGQEFQANKNCCLVVRLQAAENQANLIVCHAYLDGELIASASACEAFVEGYSNNYATMTIPVPAGSTARVERDPISGDAGAVAITVVDFD